MAKLREIGYESLQRVRRVQASISLTEMSDLVTRTVRSKPTMQEGGRAGSGSGSRSRSKGAYPVGGLRCGGFGWLHMTDSKLDRPMQGNVFVHHGVEEKTQTTNRTVRNCVEIVLDRSRGMAPFWWIRPNDWATARLTMSGTCIKHISAPELSKSCFFSPVRGRQEPPTDERRANDG